MPTLADAHALDRDDPLRALHSEFFVDADRGPLVYANGNSLGRLPLATREVLRRTIDIEWGSGLSRSWQEWIDLPRDVGDLVGTTMLGASTGETLIADSTTVNFYKLAAAALALAAPRRVVITDAGNFPTDRFVLQGLRAICEIVAPDPSPAVIAQALSRHAGDVALVTLSHVSYRSGAKLDLPAITQLAHEQGALVLWDVSHAAGAVHIDLAEHGVDLAVGCTYKYLNAGPGAPAFLYVRRALQQELVQPIQGWFGAADQFAMRAGYEPAPGIDRFLSGTSPVLGLRAVEASVGVLAEAGLDALAAKGEALTDFLIACVDPSLSTAGFDVVTPRDAERRGVHVSIRHEEAWRICQALVRHQGVIPDFREPDIIRVGLAPAYSRFTDAFAVAARLRAVVDQRQHLTMPTERSRVT